MVLHDPGSRRKYGCKKRIIYSANNRPLLVASDIPSIVKPYVLTTVSRTCTTSIYLCEFYDEVREKLERSQAYLILYTVRKSLSDRLILILVLEVFCVHHT